MQSLGGIKFFIGRDNNFGLVRLIFAISVVVAHAYYLKGLDSEHNYFFPHIGTVGLGDLAVDGFFVISGFLITKSLNESPSWVAFLCKRVARIFPGFIVAYIFSLFIVGPLVGGQFNSSIFETAIYDMLLLRPPVLDHAFEGLAHPDLNGSMWTISYEFQCYLLVIAMGFWATIARRQWHLLITISLICAYLLRWRISIYFFNHFYTRIPVEVLRFSAIFFIGSEFYIWKDKVLYNRYRAAIALIILSLLINVHQVSEIAFAIFGGYITLCFALASPYTIMSRLSNKFDVSYGVYLYAWPEQNLIIYYDPDVSTFLFCLFSLIIAVLFGSISWIIIEKPFLRSKYLFHSKSKSLLSEAI